MESAALRCACASTPARPTALPGRRRIAAGFNAGAPAAWAPKTFAEPLKRGLYAKAASLQAGGAPGAAPGQPPAVGDGLDEVRQRIRQYGLRSEEDKLISVLRELQADERRYLKLFKEAEAEGHDGGMRIRHSDWKQTTEKMELLKADPREFARMYGYLYDIAAEPTTAKRSWFSFF